MAGLIVSVSGIRGIVGDTLTVEVAMRFARAFGEQLGKGLVLVGTDGRPSGRMLKHAVCAGLNASGCQTMDVGVVPTPTMGVGITALKAVGGIQITASHNSAPYNGMKLFGSDGRVIPAILGEVVKKRYESNSLVHGKWDEAPEEAKSADVVEKHVQKILAVTDVEAVAKSGWRVFVDANGGAGGPIATKLLNALGVEAILIGEKADGNFTHEPEPIATNLASIGPMVKKAKVHAGFVLDPDADRLALFNEKGEFLGEELTLALAAWARLEEKPGPMVVNMSTSLASENAAARFNQPCYRSAVGEANVVDLMIDKGAVIGGEGNGGVIDPRIGWVRDPFIGMALILGLMTRKKKPLGDLAKEIPLFNIHKDKIDMNRSSLEIWYERVAEAFPDGSTDRTDGLRISWQEKWIHLRPSNTEPVVRVIAEAPTMEEAIGLSETCKTLVP